MWRIGYVTLPVDPSRVTDRQAAQTMTFPKLSYQPAILHFGPETRVLNLEGVLHSENFTVDEVEKYFVVPLRNMAGKPSGFNLLIYDDQQNFWTATSAGTGSINVSITDEVSQVRRGDRSVKITVSSGSAATWKLSKTYTSPLKLSSSDFVTLWWYGAASNSRLRISIGTTTDYYYSEFLDEWTGWRRVYIPLANFTSYGSPDWDNVTDIWIEQLTSNVQAAWYLDRFVIGVGQYVSTPYERYNGIYLVKSFSLRDDPTRVFRYTIELWDEDDYF